MRNGIVKIRLSQRQAEALLQLAEEADFDTFDCHEGQSYRWRRSAGIALDKLTSAIVRNRPLAVRLECAASTSDRCLQPADDDGPDA